MFDQKIDQLVEHTQFKPIIQPTCFLLENRSPLSFLTFLDGKNTKFDQLILQLSTLKHIETMQNYTKVLFPFPKMKCENYEIYTAILLV